MSNLLPYMGSGIFSVNGIEQIRPLNRLRSSSAVSMNVICSRCSSLRSITNNTEKSSASGARKPARHSLSSRNICPSSFQYNSVERSQQTMETAPVTANEKTRLINNVSANGATNMRKKRTSISLNSPKIRITSSSAPVEILHSECASASSSASSSCSESSISSSSGWYFARYNQMKANNLSLYTTSSDKEDACFLKVDSAYNCNGDQIASCLTNKEGQRVVSSRHSIHFDGNCLQTSTTSLDGPSPDLGDNILPPLSLQISIPDTTTTLTTTPETLPTATMDLDLTASPAATIAAPIYNEPFVNHFEVFTCKLCLIDVESADKATTLQQCNCRFCTEVSLLPIILPIQ